MQVTNHAKKRYRRTGLPKRTLDKMVDLAYQKGLRRHDVSRKLCRYMDALREGRLDIDIVLYNNFVWVFDGDIVITCYPIPHEYQTAAATLLRRKKMEYEITHKSRVMDVRSKCACGNDVGEVYRLWNDGKCEVQLFICDDCGGARAWAVEND